jgi:hypothetical protein
MKNTKKLIGIVALITIIMFGVTSCDSGGGSPAGEKVVIEESQGKITIGGLKDAATTGAIDLKGKYVIAFASDVVAAGSIAKDGVYSAGMIDVNGLVDLKVWKTDFATSYTNFNEGGSKTITVAVLKNQSLDKAGIEKLITDAKALNVDVTVAEGKEKKRQELIAKRDAIEGQMVAVIAKT